MEGWETYFSRETAVSLEYANEAIKVKESGTLSGYGIRALAKGRLGFSYCVAEKELEQTKQRAVELAKLSPKPKTAFSFAPKTAYPKVRTYSAKTAALDERDLKEALDSIEEGLSRYTKKSRIMVTAETGEQEIRNSEGLAAASRESSFTAYCEAMNGDGFGFAYATDTDPLRNAVEFGKKAGRMSELMKKAKKPKSGKRVVVFAPEAIHSLLDILLPSLSGDWKRRGMSALTGKLGKQVLGKNFTLLDDPLADAAGATPFDAEGVASNTMPLFEKGVLKNFFYNREIAALEGSKLRGGFCARNGFSLKPSVAPSNLVIKAGTYRSFEEELGDYLLVRSVHGIHTANTTTGDFSIEANIAFAMKNGEATGMRGFLLAGNIFNVFNSIIGLEKRTETYDNLISPAIACEGVQAIG